MAYVEFDDFDAVEADKGSPPPIPAGVYHAMCAKNSVTLTKDQQGKMLVCEFQISDGEYHGRKVTHRFNVNNPNPKAQEIGRAQLKSFVLACGYDKFPGDTEDLNGYEIDIRVAVKPADDKYPASNEIKGFARKGTMDAKPDAPPFTPTSTVIQNGVHIAGPKPTAQPPAQRANNPLSGPRPPRQ